MFKFNFCHDQNETANSESTNDKVWRDAEKLICNFYNLSEEQREFKINTYKFGNTNIKSFAETDIITYLKKKGSQCILKAESNHSDLIAAEYEGGLKVWECTIDLLNYLEDNEIIFSNKKVLDLGCGCGIVGIYCLLKGAIVDFQDYNKEVLENITIPNVILNADKLQFKNCNFYSGDWHSFKNLVENDTYDYILTSETIYNKDNYQKLFNIFNEKLKYDGFVFLAAKTHYFGVGGGTREFENILATCNSLKSFVCWKCKEGLQREIVKINKII